MRVCGRQLFYHKYYVGEPCEVPRSGNFVDYSLYFFSRKWFTIYASVLIIYVTKKKGNFFLKEVPWVYLKIVFKDKFGIAGT